MLSTRQGGEQGGTQGVAAKKNERVQRPEAIQCTHKSGRTAHGFGGLGGDIVDIIKV